jgi:2-oxoglutarate ferredoxin oxidoreductase subunit alpha
LYGSNKPDIVIVGWGSTYGVMRGAVDTLSKSNSIAMVHFSEVYPLPPVDKFDYLQVLHNAKKTICVENNATGQFARLMRAETGYGFDVEIHKYDGRPFTLETFIGELDAYIG